MDAEWTLQTNATKAWTEALPALPFHVARQSKSMSWLEMRSTRARPVGLLLLDQESSESGSILATTSPIKVPFLRMSFVKLVNYEKCSSPNEGQARSTKGQVSASPLPLLCKMFSWPNSAP